MPQYSWLAKDREKPGQVPILCHNGLSPVYSRENEQAGCLGWVLQRQSEEPHLVGWLFAGGKSPARWSGGIVCCLPWYFAQQFLTAAHVLDQGKPREFRPRGMRMVSLSGSRVTLLKWAGCRWRVREVQGSFVSLIVEWC